MDFGKDDPAPPRAPDPFETAQAQTASNVETALATAFLNRINEATPYGTATWTPTGEYYTLGDDEGDVRWGGGRRRSGWPRRGRDSLFGDDPLRIAQYQRTIELSPDQQAILDAQENLSQELLGLGTAQIGRIEDAISDPFSLESLGPRPELNDEYRQAVEDALYARATAKLDPMYEDEERRLRTQLLNTGFSVGSEGYRGALEDFRASKQDAYSAAQWDAITRGGAEQSRLFGLESSDRERAIQEMMLERNTPLNELAALIGQSGGVNLPQFSAVPQTSVGGTPVADLINQDYRNRLGIWQTGQERSAAGMGDLFGLAGSGLQVWGAAGFPIPSDPDIKTDKEPVSEADVLERIRGLPVEQWRYKAGGGKQIGPYADDWADQFGGDGKTISPVSAFGMTVASIQALADEIDQLKRQRA